MKRCVYGLILTTAFLFGFSACSRSPIPVQDPAPVIQITETVSLSTVPTSVPTPVPTAEPAETPAPSPTDSPAPTPEPTLEERLWVYIDSMSIAEKIGQVCMFGFSGTKSISSDFTAIMQEYHIGNVILYGQNIARNNKDGGFSQCLTLTDSIREASSSDIPLLISTDVEGGTVTRFKWKNSLDSARTLGKKRDLERAASQFLYIGDGLLSAGINVDLAPALDISKAPDSHFMGRRIISSDVETASRIGEACVDGLHEAGVLSIVKHFPGHGATNTDSHDRTPVVTKSYDSIRSYDLVPFREVIRHGVDGIMVSHILYESIDDAYIASQSPLIIGELLREDLGFDGIVMSDDFRMAGLRNRASLDHAAVQFLLAGGDLILCGANHTYQKQILSGLYDAVSDGTITEDRLNESVFRILLAKLKVTDWTV